MTAPAFVLAAARPAALRAPRHAFLCGRPLRVTRPARLPARLVAVLDPADAPAQEDPPVAQEQPAADGVEDVVAAVAPAADAAPAEETAPIAEAAPVHEPAPPLEAAPVAETESAEGAGPVAEEGTELAEASAPAPRDKRKRRRTRKRDVTLPLEDIVVGSELEGVVRSVTDYGAFVGEMGTPTDGLLHVSQLTAGFVENVTDIVNVGDKIKVRVLGVDIEKGNFSLTLKTPEQLSEDKRGPRDVSAGGKGGGKDSRREELDKKWREFKFEREAFVDAKVTSITDFGAFCQLVDENGEGLASAPTEGLIHISELSVERVNNVSDVVELGQNVKVRVTSTDRKRNRISMSLKPFVEQTEGRPDVSKDIAEANSNQPTFKTTFELAFERAWAQSKK